MADVLALNSSNSDLSLSSSSNSSSSERNNSPACLASVSPSSSSVSSASIVRVLKAEDHGGRKRPSVSSSDEVDAEEDRNHHSSPDTAGRSCCPSSSCAFPSTLRAATSVTSCGEEEGEGQEETATSRHSAREEEHGDEENSRSEDSGFPATTRGEDSTFSPPFVSSIGTAESQSPLGTEDQSEYLLTLKDLQTFASHFCELSDEFSEKPHVSAFCEKAIEEIAQSGICRYPWDMMKVVLAARWEERADALWRMSRDWSVIETAYSFDAAKDFVSNLIRQFSKPPCTVQRMCELLQESSPYTKMEKFLNAFKKTVSVQGFVQLPERLPEGVDLSNAKKLASLVAAKQEKRLFPHTDSVECLWEDFNTCEDVSRSPSVTCVRGREERLHDEKQKKMRKKRRLNRLEGGGSFSRGEITDDSRSLSSDKSASPFSDEGRREEEENLGRHQSNADAGRQKSPESVPAAGASGEEADDEDEDKEMAPSFPSSIDADAIEAGGGRGQGSEASKAKATERSSSGKSSGEPSEGAEESFNGVSDGDHNRFSISD